VGVQVTVTTEAAGLPFLAATDGPAYEAMRLAMREAYGESMTMLGQGGSIPLCSVFSSTFPGAEIILMGVEEPQSLMHAPNESVHPNEIADMALAEALFLRHFTGNGNTRWEQPNDRGNERAGNHGTDRLSDRGVSRQSHDG
jgi:acetylornithine deacetylase/succinyl-diaminopimelate desuccinylase-like protein